MGVVANYPLALATGLGLNAFVAFSIASQMTWADAMGLVVIEGVIILVLVLTGFRTAVFHAVPTQLKVAISVGIGLFIALIGFVDAGFVPATRRRPCPSSSAARASCQGWPVVVFGFGLALVIALWVRKVQGRDPHLDRRDARSSRSSSRRSAIGRLRRGGSFNPSGWALTVPELPASTTSSTSPTSARSASSRCSAPSRRPAWSPRSCSSSR